MPSSFSQFVRRIFIFRPPELIDQPSWIRWFHRRWGEWHDVQKGRSWRFGGSPKVEGTGNGFTLVKEDIEGWVSSKMEGAGNGLTSRVKDVVDCRSSIFWRGTIFVLTLLVTLMDRCIQGSQSIIVSFNFLIHCDYFSLIFTCLCKWCGFSVQLRVFILHMFFIFGLPIV